MALEWVTARPKLIALSLVCVAVPAVYLRIKRNVSRHTTSTTGCRTPWAKVESLPRMPYSIPHEVRSGDDEWVLAYEHVVSDRISTPSLACPAADLLASRSAWDAPVSDLLRVYSGAAQLAFSWTPQAFAIRAMIDEPPIRRTFDRDWIENLAFNSKDTVNGVYKVTYHGTGSEMMSERLELGLEPPPSYSGPAVRGLIVSEVQFVRLPKAENDQNKKEEMNEVVFVNETWMWRQKHEKPTLLETPIGKWLHGLLARWLVMKGMQAVTKRHHKKQ